MYIQASSYTEKFGGFELAPHLEASLRYAPFGFQMRKIVTQNVYIMSLHKLFTILLLTQARPLQKLPYGYAPSKKFRQPSF